MLAPATVIDAYAAHYGSRPPLLVRAPGRVNLIGEHTDYNDGFVLPAAIDRAVYVAASPTARKRIRCYAVQYGEEDSFDPQVIERRIERPWANYIRGVAAEVAARGLKSAGADLLIHSDLPQGSGLSSSAALEVAVGYTLQLLNDFNLLGEELALLAQAAENNFVGVQCGIMDQFVAALGEVDHALLIDCRDLSYRAVPLPGDVRLVVCDSRVRRSLDSSQYNERRAECAAVVEHLQRRLPHITALRDLSLDDLQQQRQLLDARLYARAHHVVSENERTLAVATALEAGDLPTCGRLMNASHCSLRDDFAVSIAELDLLAEAAQQVAGCYGSRLTGAGFGGATISLVIADAVERFSEQVTATYSQETGTEPFMYVCKAVDGVRRMRL
jgi:galactokinase